MHRKRTEREWGDEDGGDSPFFFRHSLTLPLHPVKGPNRFKKRLPEEDEGGPEIFPFKRHKTGTQQAALSQVLSSMESWNDILVWVSVALQALVERMDEAEEEEEMGDLREAYSWILRRLRVAYRSLQEAQQGEKEQQFVRELYVLLEVTGAAEACLFSQDPEWCVRYRVGGEVRVSRQQVLEELLQRVSLPQQHHLGLSSALQYWGSEVALAVVPFFELLVQARSHSRRFCVSRFALDLESRMLSLQLRWARVAEEEEEGWCISEMETLPWFLLEEVQTADEEVQTLWSLAFCGEE